ncbi:MAG TPA: TonB-dependent receptor [Caulobacteraceae bacterium]|jgi:outer membrane receptor protein involved in Fe transport
MSSIQGAVIRRRAIMLAGTALWALGTVGAAQAQAPVATTAGAAPSSSSASSSIGEIVVTGSRVIRQGLTSPTPVTSLSANELLTAQPQSLVQGLAELPALADSTTSKSVGALSQYGPGSFLNLRNLGPNRTLVLLDGQRMTPTNVFGYVDVNLLPQALISGVNLVTGGASAAYGSDAVAGVADFKLDTRFTGLKVEAGGGDSGVGDGQYTKFSIAMGKSFLDDRLHVEASYDRLDQEHAYADKRDWASSNCAVIPVPGVTTANQSVTNPRQTLSCGVTLPYSAAGGAIYTGPLTTANQGVTFGPGGTVQPFAYGTQRTSNYQIGGGGVPINQYYNFQPKMIDNVGFVRLGYDVTPDIEAYAQASVGYVNSEYILTAPNYGTPRNLTIYSGNPYIPASIQSQMTTQNIANFALGLTPTSWGPEDLYSADREIDAVVGLKGKFAGAWNWDLSYEHGQSNFDLINHDNILVQHLFRAVDAVVNPANGQVVCRSTLTNPGPASNGCVPINVFGPGAASSAALAYVQGNALSGNRIIQDNVEGSLHGDVANLWAGPVSVAVGGDYRRVQGRSYSDATSQAYPLDFTGVRGVPSTVLVQQGAWQSSNVQPARGDQTVSEGFGEVLFPLLRDLSFAKALDFNGAVRVTDYSTSGVVTTWKAGLTWRPVNDFLFRVAQSRDIRAPNVNDLYAGSSTFQTTVNDPFNKGAQANIHYITSGKADLTPETADTFTIGATYNSSWISGLTASLDYYDINIKNVISSLAPQDEVNQCFAGVQSLCPLLQRDANGLLLNVFTPSLNLAAARTRGMDFEVGLRRALSELHTGWDGTYSLRLFGNRLMEQSTTTPTLTGSNYVNRVGDMTLGNPTWQFNVMGSVDTGPYGFDIGGRFIGAGVINATYIAGDIANNNVPSVFTLDLGARYTFNSAPGRPQVYFKVSNVLNQAAPQVPATSFYTAPTNPAVYDTLGRFFNVGVKARF